MAASLLNASASDLAKILSIDEYVAKLVSDAVNKAIKTSRSIAWHIVLFALTAQFYVTAMSESQEIKEIKRTYAGLETLYKTYFPKSSIFNSWFARGQSPMSY